MANWAECGADMLPLRGRHGTRRCRQVTCVKRVGWRIGPSVAPTCFRCAEGVAPEQSTRATVGEDAATFQMAMRLQEEGVFVNPVMTPAVPAGHSMIRTSYMATHNREHLDRALGALAKVGRELSII